MLKPLAIGLMIAGVVLLLVGGLLLLADRTGIPLGRLPGDVHVEGKRWSFTFPIVTCILLSVILTVLLNLFLRR